VTEPHRLTPRERQVLEALCSGLSAREVGEQLGMSAGGVSSRRSRIYQKLAAQSLEHACQVLRAKADPRLI
jgi:DNA-binding NarL/FixJ family response regulator